MSKLIDADVLIEKIRKLPNAGIRWLVSAEAVFDTILNAPTIEPEIIRCRECKHYDGRPCGIVDWYNTADDFCSRGEKNVENS